MTDDLRYKCDECGIEAFWTGAWYVGALAGEDKKVCPNCWPNLKERRTLQTFMDQLERHPDLRERLCRLLIAKREQPHESRLSYEQNPCGITLTQGTSSFDRQVEPVSIPTTVEWKTLTTAAVEWDIVENLVKDGWRLPSTQHLQEALRQKPMPFEFAWGFWYWTADRHIRSGLPCVYSQHLSVFNVAAFEGMKAHVLVWREVKEVPDAL